MCTSCNIELPFFTVTFELHFSGVWESQKKSHKLWWFVQESFLHYVAWTCLSLAGSCCFDLLRKGVKIFLALGPESIKNHRITFTALFRYRNRRSLLEVRKRPWEPERIYVNDPQQCQCMFLHFTMHLLSVKRSFSQKSPSTWQWFEFYGRLGTEIRLPQVNRRKERKSLRAKYLCWLLNDVAGSKFA